MEKQSRAVIKFGKAVREVRLSAGLTQLELADQAGLDVAHISRIERGEKDISLTTAAKIAEAVGLKINFGDYKLTK